MADSYERGNPVALGSLYAERSLIAQHDRSCSETRHTLHSETPHTLHSQVLQGVQHLHASHIAHRDIKLANLLLTSRGQVPSTLILRPWTEARAPYGLRFRVGCRVG